MQKPHLEVPMQLLTKWLIWGLHKAWSARAPNLSCGFRQPGEKLRPHLTHYITYLRFAQTTDTQKIKINMGNLSPRQEAPKTPALI